MKDLLPHTHFEEEHNMFRDMARGFVEREITPNVERWRKESQPDRKVFREAGKLGLVGMSTPEAYGGGGEMDFRYSQVLNEGLSSADCGPIVVPFGALNNLVAPCLAKLGNEEQKQKYLVSMDAGDTTGYLAVTKPGTGSDLAGMRTFTKEDGDHYVLNGTKIFISNSMMADFALIAVITDPPKGRAGASMFIADADLEGFIKADPLRKVGLRARDTAELNFDGVRIPAENLLGKEGATFGHLHTDLAHEHLTLAYGSVAASRRAQTLTYRYAQGRGALGRPIVQHQVHSHYLADIITRVTTLQAFVDQAVMAHNVGQLDKTSASMAKYWTTGEQQGIITRCLQILGGHGFMLEYPISTHYLDSKVQTIYGGTSEIVEEIVFRRITKGDIE